MQHQIKALQLLGIPSAALMSVLFGLLLASFPMGVFVVFESEIGGDINHEYPLTHLDFFSETEMYRAPTNVSIGDVFVVLWAFYLILFVMALSGPRQVFLKLFSPVTSFGGCDDSASYLAGAIKWFSVLILISALINHVQERFGVTIDPPPVQNDLIQFFLVILAPLLEEFGFRLVLIGIPLFTLYSGRSSVRYFARCLWRPDNLNIHDYKKAVFLIVFVGIVFGFAHIAFGEAWSEGKFAQAAAGGIILGWAYLRYGFVAALLIHWATNYFIFSYVHFISQINSIPVEGAFSHPVMSSLESLLLATGMVAVIIMLVKRYRSKSDSEV